MMKRLAQFLVPAALIASAVLVAGHSSASTKHFDSAIDYYNSSEEDDSPEHKKVFWDKFRHSVDPDEKTPVERAPNEAPPREAPPREIKPREIH